jgi:membrane fusion protein (multidrug efflux system)
MSNATVTDVTPQRASSGVLLRIRSLLVGAFVLSIAGSLILGVSGRMNGWLASRTVQETDDAQVRADVTPLSTKSSGIVAVVAVEDFQRVHAGELLVQLRDDDFRAQVELAQAAVAAGEAALVNLKSQRVLQRSRIAAAQASLSAAKPDVERARLDLERERALEAANISTKRLLETATADYQRLSAELVGRHADLDAAERQIGVIDTQRTELLADLVAKQAALKVAEVNLDYTRIVAPTDGVVSERKVRPGQLVSAGTQVISVVGSSPWVVANYKEIQLAHLRVGDSAELRVDGVPDVVFGGRVVMIAPASGAVFSLLPPDNATGNYTKVAQRIPVKIVFESKQLDARVRPGMSVDASVRTEP